MRNRSEIGEAEEMRRREFCRVVCCVSFVCWILLLGLMFLFGGCFYVA